MLCTPSEEVVQQGEILPAAYKKIEEEEGKQQYYISKMNKFAFEKKVVVLVVVEELKQEGKIKCLRRTSNKKTLLSSSTLVPTS